MSTYECDGCGRKCEDPQADLSDLKARGYISCCPDRKMIESKEEIAEDDGA